MFFIASIAGFDRPLASLREFLMRRGVKDSGIFMRVVFVGGWDGGRMGVKIGPGARVGVWTLTVLRHTVTNQACDRSLSSSPLSCLRSDTGGYQRPSTRLARYQSLTLKVKLTRSHPGPLPFPVRTISCCHFHRASSLITTKLRPGNITSTLLPVLLALCAFPLLTEPPSGTTSSWNRIGHSLSRESPTTGWPKLKFSVWAEMPRVPV